MARILIVDDDTDILKICDATLSATGHETVLCSTLDEALQTLSLHPVDLILLDIMMPPLNGFDLLRAIKRTKNFNTPIIMLSGRSHASDIQKAVKLGARDYILKPFHPGLLIEKVESTLTATIDVKWIKLNPRSVFSDCIITLTGQITAVSEKGIILESSVSVLRNNKVKIQSELFEEIGVTCPPLRVSSCHQTENEHGKTIYKIELTFIDLNDRTMKYIRNWIKDKAFEQRTLG